jgi:hypothetical protein
MVARVVIRDTKRIEFMMWGPRMVYYISAWEAGGRYPGYPKQPRVGDGLMANCVQRFYQYGEDWHRGNDMYDGPLNKKTWEGISAEIRRDAIVSLPDRGNPSWNIMHGCKERKSAGSRIAVSHKARRQGADSNPQKCDDPNAADR